MNDSESLGLLATLREVTEQLAGLDLTALPELCAVQVTPDFHHGGLCGKAQLAARCPTELEEIDAIRTWAVALGAVVLLDEERPDPSGPYRQIAAVLRLPSGSVFEVWGHLRELRPSPDWVPTDPDLIPA